MTEMLLGTITGVFVTLLLIFFMSCFVAYKDRRLSDYIWVTAGQILILANSIILNDCTAVKLVINIAIAAIMMSRFFGMKLKRSAVAVVLYYAVYTSIELIVYLLLQKTVSIPVLNKLTQTNGAFLIAILTDLFVLLLIIGLNAFLKKSNLSRMDIKGWIIYTLYPLFSVVVLCVLASNVEESTTDKTINIYLFICGGLFILNLLLFYLLNNVITRELEVAKNRELVENAEHIYEMYETLSEEREIQKAQAHDYRNNLNAIHSLALKGDTAALKDYIEEQLENVDKTHDIYDTGNSIVNTVLNRKYHEAEAKGILFPIVCDNLSSVGISNSDLVTILSNILDNAIEAAGKCEEKKITLKIKVKDGILYIVSTNTYVEVKEGFKTTKADSDNHGYGLNNIRKAVADNGGECYVECEEGVFRITVLIPS